MDTDSAWNALRILRAGILTFFSIVLSALFGAVWLPLTHNFAADGALWLIFTGGLSALHLRAAYRFHRRAAEKSGEPVVLLELLSEIVYEVMALTAGGFFGALLVVGTVAEYRKTGFGGDTPLMAGLALIPLLAFVFALSKLARYLSPNGDPTSD